MKRTLRLAAALAPVAALLAAVPAPAAAATDELVTRQATLAANATAAPLQSERITSVASKPGQLGISGCFMPTAPIFVTSGLEALQVWDVRKPADPQLVGTLPNLLFENEAMNCGERRTASGTERFALIGVDLYQAAPDDPQHVNAGGGELLVVDVTNPRAPKIRSRAPGSTSTHTVACATPRDCTHAYSAGNSRSKSFSVFDLRNLDKPRELDARPRQQGFQAYSSPTAGHKWNFDAARYGTHTGFDGSAIFDVSKPARPRLVTTTGAAGRGEDPRHPGYNDFIHHNSFRPNAKAFKAGSKPSLANGNVLLVTEEDYEQTDCSKAGSFQTWWVKRLDGTKDAIVPLDKVELADLGSFPSPQGAFCSSHWFDFRPGGLVAVGFYGGGTQVLDVRDPRDIKPYAHSVHGASEVWDAMWVPVYRDGKQTGAKTRLVYSVDLVRGLDVYRVTLPGQNPPASTSSTPSDNLLGAAGLPLGLVGGALGLSAALSRRRRTAKPA
jgi:cell division septation protein DedD